MGERTFVQPVKSNEEDGYLEYTKERNQYLQRARGVGDTNASR